MVLIIHNHFNPVFGEMHMNKIRTIHIQKFFNDKALEKSKIHTKENISASTLDTMHNYICTILNKAVTWGILKVSPCKGINLPKMTKRNLTEIYS